MAKIRTDVSVSSLLGIMILVIFFAAIIPTIVTQTAIAAGCMTGAGAVLVLLIPLFMVLGIIAFLAKWATGGQ